MDVYTDQHTISQEDFPSKNNIFIDVPDFSDEKEWPTEESFDIIEIFKWRDISDGIYRIKNVTHRKGKFGNSAILALKAKDSDDFRVWAPKRLVEDLIYYPFRFVNKMGIKMSNEGNEYFDFKLKNKLMIIINFFKYSQISNQIKKIFFSFMFGYVSSFLYGWLALFTKAHRG